jgi:hypothetical protein
MSGLVRECPLAKDDLEDSKAKQRVGFGRAGVVGEVKNEIQLRY